ncbi:hypothetical protein P171DRAFT_428052 [Karstenula rhodostoma CBS 690.94]|uniref:Calcofluor white hypersensitive protein n=1 Tax=Karstenula rhodostoma CBS 690.94 TaxID=1392251 RepID=A0A9P4UI50_9PLEO|nr:hypothetical protein P171DRAFT_428052 [Karstenula rhodostoma CBS 690.94]
MAGRQVGTLAAVAGLGGVGYYLYSAGGDPKLAEKKLEHDAAEATRKLRGDYPGQDKEAKKAGEEAYETARAKAQGLANDAKAKADKADAELAKYSADAKKKFEELKTETGREVNAAANKFDKEVTDGINKSKGWFGGIFGGK